MADTTETAIYKLRVEGQAEIDRLTKSVNDLAKAEESAVASARTASQGLQNQIARMDPLVKANQQYQKGLETNLRYREAEKGTLAQQDAHLALVTNRYNEQVKAIQGVEKATGQVASTTKLARYEMINLSRQLQDVGVSLFSGQSPLTVLVQQGSQIADISASSGVSIGNMFKQVGSAIGSALTPVRVLTGGILGLAGAVAYLGVQWDGAQKETERALIGIGARTGTTVKDINNFAKANASAAGLSVGEARTAAIEFTKTGNIAIAGLHGVGEAIHGYATLTGTDATDATKKLAAAFSGDLTKGADELNKTYGFLDSGLRKQIETLQLSGDRMGAVQVIIDKMAPANIKAAQSVDFLTRAWTGFKNVVSNITSPPGQSDQDRLSSLQARRSDAASTGNVVSGQNPLGLGASSGAKEAELAALDKQIDALQKKLDSLTTESAQAQLRAMSTAGDEVVKSIIPQIEQIDNLEKKLKALQDAQNTPGVSRSLGADDAAATAIQNQLQALRESQAEAARYNDRVAEISKSWGDVGQSTALALQAAANQLPVANAVGGAAKMAAQYAADYKNAMEGGKTATEATEIAAARHKDAQAQINAQAKETLFTLQNQLEVSRASTGVEQIQAQHRATYNKLVHDGVAPALASAVAAAEEADSRAKATAAVEKQAESIRDSTRMIYAQIDGNEAQVAAAIAYKNAIQSGADSTAAAAASSATLANYMAKAALAAHQMAQAQANAEQQSYLKANGFDSNGIVTPESVAALGSGGSEFSPSVMNGVSLTTESGNRTANAILRMQALDQSTGTQGAAERAFSSGGLAAAIKAVVDAPNMSGIDPAIAAAAAKGGYDLNTIFGTPQSAVGSKISAYDSLVQLQNSQTKDPLEQASNLKAELAWLQTLPSSIAQQQKIADLTNSIDQLTKSTDGLNSTNQEALSPYYTQDPRTSHIGFRSQGMAMGGEVLIPGGYSANDNMTVTVPVASGELLSVRRPGQGSGGSQPINITNNIHVGDGANVDQFKRTVFQATQNTVRQIRAAS